MRHHPPDPKMIRYNISIRQSLVPFHEKTKNAPLTGQQGVDSGNESNVRTHVIVMNSLNQKSS